MLSYTLKRFFAVLPVGIGVVVIVSMLIHIVPGDPVDILLGEFATFEEKQALRDQLGLSQPLWRQLQHYFMSLAQGDLGTSLIYHQPVAELIGERILPTLELACLAILVALMISMPLGIASALHRGKAIDYSAMFCSLLGVAVPNFWLGPMLILIFSIKLGWFPVSERAGLDTYVLPALTLGTALAAMLSRMTRNSLLETLKEDYVRTAKAKGVGGFFILMKHALRNASLPVVTILGLQFGVLLTGAVITESIFDWPGLGSLILQGLNQRDYPLVQGCVLIFSMSYLVVNLLTDILYAAIDPRISLGKKL